MIEGNSCKLDKVLTDYSQCLKITGTLIDYIQCLEAQTMLTDRAAEKY